MSTTKRLLAVAPTRANLAPHDPTSLRALYDGPVKTQLVPFDPTAPHTRSSIPPTFILALLVAVLGIPLYLLLNGGFKSTGDRLEDRMKAPDIEGSAAFAGDEGGGDDDDDKRKRKRELDDLDEPGGILEFDDLKSLGGLVGFAAVVVLAFAIFPEELDVMLASVTGGVDIQTVSTWMGNGGRSRAENPPAGRAGQQEIRTEQIITQPDGTTTGYTEKIIRQGPPKPGSPLADDEAARSPRMNDMLGGRSMIDLCKPSRSNQALHWILM